MDLSQLSDEDLKRLANNDYTKLSDEAKTMFKTAPQPAQEQPAGTAPAQTQPMPQQGPIEPGMLEQAGNFAMENIVTPVVGAAQTAAQYGMSNPILTGGAALGAAKYGAIKNLAQQGINTFQTNNLAKLGEQIRIGERFGQDMSGLKQIFQQQSQAQAQKMAAQQAAANQPGMIQRGMDVASRMRNAAAQRVIGFGASGAAVPAAVAAVPGAMMYDAYKNYQTQTPEQRKQSAMEALSGQGMGQAGIY
jgi:hypothetical protein